MTDEDALRQLVYAGDAYKEFGAFTVADVRGAARS